MEQHLKRIQDKVQQLLKKQSLLQKEAEKATKENAALKEKLAEQTRHTEELEQKLAAYKMATGSLGEADKKELEKKMNQYIREIDRCIAMLAE